MGLKFVSGVEEGLNPCLEWKKAMVVDLMGIEILIIVQDGGLAGVGGILDYRVWTYW